MLCLAQHDIAPRGTERRARWSPVRLMQVFNTCGAFAWKGMNTYMNGDSTASLGEDRGNRQRRGKRRRGAHGQLKKLEAAEAVL